MFDLKEHLICPACQKKEIRLGENNWYCNACGAGGESRKGFPIFASDDGDVFDERWANHQKPQATDQWWKAKDLWGDFPKGKVILDAGCGIGRYTARAFEDGAKEVVSLDTSPHAIKALRENVPAATPLQASLLSIPIEDNTFDGAFSIGVIHHTPDPKQALKEIVRVVKPGGFICLWVYSDDSGDPQYFPVADMLHEITRACPKPELLRIFREYAPRIRDLFNKRWEPLMQVMRVSISENDEECISDTFDWHGPRYRSRHSESQLGEWLVEFGCTGWKLGHHKVNILAQKK